MARSKKVKEKKEEVGLSQKTEKPKEEQKINKRE